MFSFVAPILTKVVVDRMTQNKQATVQTQTPRPKAPDIYRKYKRGISRTGPKFRSRISSAAPVEGTTFEPVSQYNSILRKQLGLLTSQT
jgi:hypothetical protein